MNTPNEPGEYFFKGKYRDVTVDRELSEWTQVNIGWSIQGAHAYIPSTGACLKPHDFSGEWMNPAKDGHTAGLNNEDAYSNPWFGRSDDHGFACAHRWIDGYVQGLRERLSKEIEERKSKK